MIQSEKQEAQGTSIRSEAPSGPFVLIGVPSYDGTIAAETAKGLLAPGTKTRYTAMMHGSSLLCRGFNFMFSLALNAREQGVTHFLLHHADIGPEEGWLDKMMEIMKREGADVLSAVSPIKNQEGLTSTALDEDWRGQTAFICPRRLTLNELYNDFPPTFTHPKLLLNTALMLIDLSKPWVENICFRMEDRIIRNKDGKFEAGGCSEDWVFSRDARALGARLFVTREVTLNHFGRAMFPVNGNDWGVCATDGLTLKDRLKEKHQVKEDSKPRLELV